MCNKQVPQPAMIEKLEGIIERLSPEEFFDDRDLMKWYAGFIHTYSIKADDEVENTKKMMEDHCPKGIHDVVNPVQEAFVFTVLANNYKWWWDRQQHNKTDKIWRKNLSRWTQNPKKKKDEETELRVENQSGWNSEGRRFYRDAVQFFKTLRSDENKVRMVELVGECERWFHDNKMAPLARERQRKRGRKRARSVEPVEELDYSSLLGED